MIPATFAFIQKKYGTDSRQGKKIIHTSLFLWDFTVIYRFWVTNKSVLRYHCLLFLFFWVTTISAIWGFLKYGYPQSSSISNDGIFPSKPSNYGGIPIYGHRHFNGFSSTRIYGFSPSTLWSTLRKNEGTSPLFMGKSTN